MMAETLIPLTAAGTISAVGLAFVAKRKVFPPTPKPDDDHFTLPIKLLDADAEDISSRYVKGVRIPRRTLLTLGASGSGKSTTLQHFADDLRADHESQIVVYDHKDDYQTFFEERGADMIRLSSGGSADENGNAIAWNIFEEIETEEDADELERALFPDGGDFWTDAARQLFAATLKYLRREMVDPDNADLVAFWRKTTPEKMHERLTRDGHEDLASAASAINPETE